MKTTKMFLLLSLLFVAPAFMAAQDLETGDYYALIIGIDDYSGDWTPMSTSVRDAEAVKNTLETHYKFDHFRTLYNEEASRIDIFRAFEWLMVNVTENDNVLIYYSGHGDYNAQLDEGFWVPADAQSDTAYEVIANGDIQSLLKGIKSRHTLLISDAAFAGDIFRGTPIMKEFEDSPEYYKQVHELKSRKAITSGGIDPVMGGGSDGHSVFAYWLLRALNTNQKQWFDATELYNGIAVPVTNNSEQSPEFHPIKNLGDAGGQFVFIRKDE